MLLKVDHNAKIKSEVRRESVINYKGLLILWSLLDRDDVACLCVSRGQINVLLIQGI